jgi:hypothetical protein
MEFSLRTPNLMWYSRTECGARLKRLFSVCCTIRDPLPQWYHVFVSRAVAPGSWLVCIRRASSACVHFQCQNTGYLQHDNVFLMLAASCEHHIHHHPRLPAYIVGLNILRAVWPATLSVCSSENFMERVMPSFVAYENCMSPKETTFIVWVYGITISFLCN